MNPQASRLTVGHELPFWVSSRSCPRDSLSSSVRIAALSLTSRFRLRNKVLSTRSPRDRDRNHVRRKESTECHGGTDFTCWRIVLEFASNTSTLRASECVSTHPVIWTTNVAYLFCKNFTKCRSHTQVSLTYPPSYPRPLPLPRPPRKRIHPRSVKVFSPTSSFFP